MDISSLLGVILYLLVVGGICWLLWWLIGFIGLPEPFNKIARAIIAIVAVILCIQLLLSLLGGTTPWLRLR